MYKCTGNVVWRDGGERTNWWALVGGGGNMEVPFMTTSLMFAVSGQQAPESSESEINEREPQQRGKQSTQYECWLTGGRWRVNKNKLDG